MKEDRNLERIFKKYLENKCSPDEVEWLVSRLSERNLKDTEDPIYNQLTEDLSRNIDPELKKNLRKRLHNILESGEKISSQSYHKSRIRRIATQPYMKYAAAVLLITLAASAYFLPGNKPNSTSLQTTSIATDKIPEIKPGEEKAIVILADGKKVVLDKAHSGEIANDGNSRVTISHGEISFEAAKSITPANSIVPRFNSVVTPNGGTYLVHLSDGSKVWLNAASSLRFPDTFSGESRVVELHGEGYFEVAHDASRPFRVKVNNMQVEVLGTRFNIDAYRDQGEILTTLVDGSIRVNANGNNKTLKPKEQISLKGDLFSEIKTGVNTDRIIAWQRGNFDFTNETLSQVGRDLKRWYQINIKIDPTLSDKHISGVISRNNNLSAILNMLEFTMGIQSKMADGSVILYKN